MKAYENEVLFQMLFVSCQYNIPFSWYVCLFVCLFVFFIIYGNVDVWDGNYWKTSKTD